MEIKKLFGQKVKECRLKLSLTQEELAERIGISAKSLSQIELGNNFVSAENLNSLCEGLNINPKLLFDFCPQQEKKSLENVILKLKNNKKLLNKISKIIEIIE